MNTLPRKFFLKTPIKTDIFVLEIAQTMVWYKSHKPNCTLNESELVCVGKSIIETTGK